MLINDILTFKAQVGGIQKTMNWPTWEPYIRGAEIRHIIPAIGEELYDELAAVTTPTPEQKKLLDRLRPALAFFAYLDAIPYLVTATGDAGLVMNTPANTANITKWMYVTLVKDAAAKADQWFETALSWLEHHADQFPTWTASPSYTVTRGRIIASATEWSRAFPAGRESRRLFLSVRNYLHNSEVDFLMPLLGPALYSGLITKLKTAPLTLFVQEAEVLRLSRLAIANHAFAEAIPFLNINEDFRIVSETDGIVNEDELETGRLNAILKDCKDKASAYAADLVKYLNTTASPTVLPDYYHYERYEAPNPSGPRGGFPNDPANPYFVLG
ncbi:hypothetical protein LX87_04093 [Larkinella arboricola]|uniref:Uncharacterized protein n=1 Tax=Larkinella arboricola TaxID=643671 RepID=A0A327WPC2_LARAB|nr:DUF6712 family protein [Larkinella arboricola]RAJ94208.1 hypothetical protein LX87_04093 [Larkinella arboricola]